VVAPLLDVLLLRLLRRRAGGASPAAPTRLVSAARPVDSLGYVLDRTTVLLARPDASVEVLPAGSLVWPPLLGRAPTTYAVLTHAPVDVWLRIGPFASHDDRNVQQVELRLRVALADSVSGLADLLEADAPARPAAGGGESGRNRSGQVGASPLDGFGERLLARLADAVAARTADVVRRHTIDELAGTSLKVVLDEALPTTFLGGSVTRSALEVLDVDWPTEGRGWSHTAMAAALGRAGARGT
jgi:hypothetical protein